MKKWMTVSLASTLFASAALTGCSSDASKDASTPGDTPSPNVKQELRLAYPTEPPTLDISTVSANAAFTIENMINEGLYRLDKNGKAQPAMAAALPTISSDGKTYTIKLRDGITWSDGTPVTAHDFEYSWKRSLDPASKCEYAAMLGSWIKGASDYTAGKTPNAENVGVKATDDKTLTIELLNPLAFFTDALTFPLFFPQKKEFVDKSGGKFGADADKTLANGPFKLEKWDHEQSLVLVKNDKYWDAQNVKLEQVTYEIVKDQQSGMNLYSTNEVDFVEINRDGVQEWKGKPELVANPEIVSFYVQYNQGKVAALKNAKIRKALALAVDRQAFVDIVLGNGSVPATGFIPGRVKDGSGGDFRQAAGDSMPKFDPAAAKKLLAEGLQETGLTALPKISILGDDTENAKKTMEFLQAQYKQNLGVDIDVQALPHKLRLDKQKVKDYDLVVAGWSGDYNDAIAYLEILQTKSEFNTNGFSNPEYDQLVDAARIEADPKKRAQEMLDAEKIVLDQMPIGPLYFRSKAYLKRHNVEGMFFPQTGAEYELKYVTITGK
jgi:oligopeptide transport system substrate-binding protein